jgi:beta-carotene ketolase (CrtW type)
VRISKAPNSRGIVIAITIYFLWFGAFCLGMFRMNVWDNLGSACALTILLAFLWTGLFIIAHDAIHGTVAPGAPRLNNFVGRICAFSYAMFDYKYLNKNHHKHHRYSSTGKDPDYHDGKNKNLSHWLLKFISEYMSLKQLAAIGTYYSTLYFICGIEWINLLFFSLVPSLLSLLQLFYFGTYLPHREPTTGYTNRYRAVSSNFGTLLSFLTCYHFGYHLEHHMEPFVPWWGLPNLHKRLNELQKV